MVNKAISEGFNKELIRSALEKKKGKYYLNTKDTRESNNKMKYINKLNRTETSIIFKARTRMIDTKTNYRGKYQDTICRHCKKDQETQEHILEQCDIIHPNSRNKVTKQELSMRSGILLKLTANKMQNTMDIHLK